jgi:D-alanyl-D-alanine carboxypeptidase
MMLRHARLSFLVGAAMLVPFGAFARPTLLFEPYNGTILYAEDADVPWFPASLTKLMTAYVAFEAPNRSLKGCSILPLLGLERSASAGVD